MSGLTFDQLKLKEAKVKELLDEPAVKFLKDTTVLALLSRSYDIAFFQIDITVTNQIMVTNAIYAIAAWHGFGTYGQSISTTLQLQDIGAYKANLAHYKEIAQQLAILVGIDLAKDITPVDDDPIAVMGVGGSLLDKVI